MSTDRTPPNSTEAEEQLLSCCLLDGSETISRCITERLRPESFYAPANRLLFGVIVDLFQKNPPVTVAMLMEELSTRKQLNEAGGVAYLMRVTSKEPTTAHASYFIAQVREKASLREALKSSVRLTEKIYGHTGDDVGELLADSVGELMRIQAHESAAAEPSKEQVGERVLSDLAEVMAGRRTTKADCLSWGISSLDQKLVELFPGELCVIAGRPGEGKSSLMRQIVGHHAVRLTSETMVFTYEVPTDHFLLNLAQTLSMVPYGEFDRLHPDFQREFCAALKSVVVRPNLTVVSMERTLEGLTARVRARHMTHPVRLVAVDYLQIMSEPMLKGENRDTQLGRITKALKNLAVEIHGVILLLSQLNRSSERDNRQPSLHDLRESGNIENDADRVVFIHYPETNPLTKMPQSRRDEETEMLYANLLQRKGRNVGIHSAGVYFQNKIACFRTIEHTATS